MAAALTINTNSSNLFSGWFTSSPKKTHDDPNEGEGEEHDVSFEAPLFDSSFIELEYSARTPRNACTEKREEEEGGGGGISQPIRYSLQRESIPVKRVRNLLHRSLHHEQAIAHFAQKAASFVQVDGNEFLHFESGQRRCNGKSNEVNGRERGKYLNRLRQKFFHSERVHSIEELNVAKFYLEEMLKLQRATATDAQAADPVAHGLEVADTLTKLGKVCNQLGKDDIALKNLSEALTLQRLSLLNNEQIHCNLIRAETCHCIGTINFNRLLKKRTHWKKVRADSDHDINAALISFKEERTILTANLQLKCNTNQNTLLYMGFLSALIGLLEAKIRNYYDSMECFIEALEYFQASELDVDNRCALEVIKVLGCRRMYHMFILRYWEDSDVI